MNFYRMYSGLQVALGDIVNSSSFLVVSSSISNSSSMRYGIPSSIGRDFFSLTLLLFWEGKWGEIHFFSTLFTELHHIVDTDK